jgi:hypothetical protein
MSSRTVPIVSAFAGTIAMSLWIGVPSASGASLDVDGVRYLPTQNVSYEFGSKSVSGYFVQEAATCVVTLMISEKSNPDLSPPLSSVRVRLTLDPGQIAGLDSEEGRSLNVACGKGATTLLVDVGERDKLVALQKLALPNTVAKAP